MDSLMLQAVLREWKEWLPGGRVSKVTQPAPAVVVLAVHGGAWSGKLLLSAESGSPRAHATEVSFESPPTPPAFCQILRRALGGRLMGEPRLVGGDRVVALPFLSRIGVAGPDEINLVAELTGRQAALLLIEGPVPGGEVAAAVGSARGTERLAIGSPYVPPPWPEGARELSDYTEAGLADALSAPALAGRPLYRRLVQAVMGLSPTAAREVCARAGLDAEDKEADDTQYRRLIEAARQLFKEALEDPLEPFLYRDRAGSPVAATPFAFSHLEESYDAEPIETANEASAALYETRAEGQRAVKLRQDLLGVVDRALKRLRRKVDKVREEIARGQRAEHERRCGELLLAHLNEVRRGMKEITVRDDFEPGGPPLTIELDPAVTPQVNAARYFKRSKKWGRSLANLEVRLAEVEGEVAYLEATRQAGMMSDEEGAEGLLEELSAAGFAPWRAKSAARKKPRRTSQEPSVRRFRAAEGWEVWVGKNARSNDQLTTRLARSRDLWFHAQGLPGAHVLLRGVGRGEPPAEALGWAAAAAAFFSRGRGSTKVRVDYTEAKNVSKPKSTKPGQVVVRWKKTILVAPATPESLEERELT